MKEIDKVTKKRLIYVKRLLMHAEEHISHRTEFDRMISVHHLDNAVELLLKSVAATYGISFKNPLAVTFPALWNRVNKKYEENQGFELPNKTEMFYLHRIRSDVQHLGRTPFSLETVKDLDERTHDFIQTIFNSVYGLNYNELFLGSLVSDERIRKLLMEAEKCFADEKWKEAIMKVSIALTYAKAITQKKRHLPPMPRILMGLPGVDERVSILVLGLDIEKYNRFIKNTPAVMYPLRDEPVIQWIGKPDYTRENTLFCFNFALDAILSWGF